ncbi:hypothetical protein RCH09_003776 [Actimicrobium sp. GrIS 1.19]|uniref:hypothetical protein n=1 Tax=Actimicrobium sp. GrIS 1.19 TaxID=3071708 RepID=UPI002E0BEEB6|nr:hypothetical protein [Actimicrobium sp. GrIS 1.19]
MGYKYGEMFARLDVPGMGHLGAKWCGLNSQGTLVMMSHENFYQKVNSPSSGPTYYYIGIGHSNLPQASASANGSIRMIAEYFAEGKDIILAVGTFTTDGGYSADGQILPSVFKEASGRVANSKMLHFDRETGTIACEVIDFCNV